MNEKALWESVSQKIEGTPFHFGTHWSFNFRNDPKRLPFVLSRYKFAAKMSRQAHSVLELGCSDGIGTPILAEKKQQYVGIDLDEGAILDAQRNYEEAPHFSFHFDDFMGKQYGQFDSVVSLDVIEHIHQEFEAEYLETVWKNTCSTGIAIIGTPNITSQQYASKASQLGHVNLFDQNRLVSVLSKYFGTVFPFGMNDEVAHTGYANMSHYLLCVCCNRREHI